MTRQFCENHSEIVYKVNRLNTRMDRIELGIVGCLFMLVTALWMLWDLPGQIKADRSYDAPSVVSPAHADSLK